jgi:hypothetical protein
MAFPRDQPAVARRPLLVAFLNWIKEGQKIWMNWCCIVDFEKEVASCLFASQLKREELIGRASFPVGGLVDEQE